MGDYTPIYTPGTAITATASAPVTGGQLVEVTGPGTVGPAAAASAKVVGVAAYDAAAGVRLTVHKLAGAVHELTAGAGGVTAGQAVAVGASATAVLPAGDGDAQVGLALTTGAQDAKVRVLGAPGSGGGPAPDPTPGLFGSASLNFPSIAAGDEEELTITVTGAAEGDAVALAAPPAPEAGLVWSGRVTSVNTVTVRLTNITASPVDPAVATWGAHVFKH